MNNGFNMVDFIDLPGFERCIIRLILRESEMTYAQLVAALATLPEDQQMDQRQLDTALGNLSADSWLVHEGDGEQRRYRVGVLQRTSTYRHSVLDGLELESIDRHHTYQIDLEPAERMLSVKSGGKRTLPAHLWDCLTDPAPEERSDTSAKQRTGTLNAANKNGTPKIH